MCTVVSSILLWSRGRERSICLMDWFPCSTVDIAMRQSVSRSQLLRPSVAMQRFTWSMEAICIPPPLPILQPSRRSVVMELLNCVCVREREDSIACSLASMLAGEHIGSPTCSIYSVQVHAYTCIYYKSTCKAEASFSAPPGPISV